METTRLLLLGSFGERKVENFEDIKKLDF